MLRLILGSRISLFRDHHGRAPLVRRSDTFWELRVPHNSVNSTVFDAFWVVNHPLTSFRINRSRAPLVTLRFILGSRISLLFRYCARARFIRSENSVYHCSHWVPGSPTFLSRSPHAGVMPVWSVPSSGSCSQFLL